jgi:hypothetical protein
VCDNDVPLLLRAVVSRKFQSLVLSDSDRIRWIPGFEEELGEKSTDAVEVLPSPDGASRADSHPVLDR